MSISFQLVSARDITAKNCAWDKKGNWLYRGEGVKGPDHTFLNSFLQGYPTHMSKTDMAVCHVQNVNYQPLVMLNVYCYENTATSASHFEWAMAVPRKHKPLQNVLNKTSIKHIFVNSRKRLQNVWMKRFVNISHKTFVKHFVNAYYTSY